MKIKDLLFLGLVGIILSSCSRTDNSTAFMKRKYLDWFYAKNHEKAKVNKVVNPEVTQFAVNTASSPEVKQTNDPDLTVTASSEKRLPLNVIKPFAHKDAIATKAESVKENNEVKLSFHQIKRELRKAKHSERNSSEVNQVLLVILAIFIPPLAVYLKDGLHTSFWIDVILTLLFFLPGVIYALLIVLDVI